MTNLTWSEAHDIWCKISSGARSDAVYALYNKIKNGNYDAIALQSALAQHDLCDFPKGAETKISDAADEYEETIAAQDIFGAL